MRAAVLHEFGSPLVIEDRPVPVPHDEDVLIQVESCGVCHSDLHLAAGEWSRFAALIQRPLILGHEIVGRVVDRGKSVRDVQIGARVGVPWLFWSCGECAQCRAGRENICAARKITGVTVDGGYAEFLRAPASHVAQLPESLDAAETAPLFCAGVTVHRAIKNAGIERGQRVGVFGIGGLGHLAVQLAHRRGAEVFALDLAEDKLQLARDSGAAKTLLATPDSAKELRAAGGLHYAVVTAAVKAAFDLALQCLAPGGALVVVGLPAEPLSFDAGKLASGENRILSSAVGTREDIRETLDLATAGHLRCHVESRPLEAVNEALDQMRRGQLTGRVVLRLSQNASS
jgi:propanol-preferring alcohol dehydrogenase